MRVETKILEVAVLFVHSRDVRTARRAAKFAVPFLRPEEPQFVLHHRSAKIVAIVVSAELVFRNAAQVVKVVGGVQNVVAAEIERTAVELVGPALGNDVYDRAHRLSKLRTVAVSQNLEFLDGVNRGIHKNGSVRADVVVVDTIDQEDVAGRVISVDRKIDTRLQAFMLGIEI